MRNANTGVFAAFVLVFFLLLLAGPMLFLLYRSGFLRLPELTYYNITIAATAGLFVIPFFLVFLAAISLAAKRKKAAAAGLKLKREPEHYPWEDVFRSSSRTGTDRFKATAKKVGPSAPKPSITALAVVAVLVAASIVFFVMIVPGARNAFTNIGKGPNLTNLSNLTNMTDLTKLSPAEDASNATKNESTLLQFFKAKLSNLRKAGITNLTEAARLAEAAKTKEEETKEKQKQEKEARQKGQEALALAAKFKAAAATVSKTVSKASNVKVFWPYALVGIGVLVLIAGSFYFYKAKKVKPATEWLSACIADSADWLVAIFSDVKRNSVKLFIFTVVIAVAALAFVFRNWFKVKLSGFSKVFVPVLGTIRESAVSIFYAAKNFLLAYRLYILIGVVVLLVVLGILFALARKAMGKEKAEKEKALAKTK